MELDKNSLKADALVNLYRAAFYLAKGAQEVGLDFFNKAKKQFKLKPIGEIKTKKQQLYWAEKILDQYIQLKYDIIAPVV